MTKSVLSPVSLSPTSKRNISHKLLLGALLVVGGLFGTWMAVHHVPGVGPWVADSLRSVAGVEGVARLEDVVYAARDELNQLVRSGELPRKYWETEQEAGGLLSPTSRPLTARSRAIEVDDESELIKPIEKFTPQAVGAMYENMSTSGDGVWVDVKTRAGAVAMRKTLIHPDEGRAWAELFVVAIDLRRVNLHLVAGKIEPQNEAPGSKNYQRRAQIPKTALNDLLAAFNGGFKSQHGHFGAVVDGVTLVAPKKTLCTIAMSREGELKIGTWESLSSLGDFRWLRQTPGCMVEDGQLHAGLAREENKNWGATLSGETVIRRSAIGLSADGGVLFMGISNDTTARALALGMRHVGATSVAQLDVNYSYPKFIVYDALKTGEIAPRSLVDGFVFHKDQYLRKEARDFFYLTRSNKSDAMAGQEVPRGPQAS